MSEHHATCSICEVGCGITVTVGPDGRTVERIRGDAAYPPTAGYVCPKGAALRELHHDPDRLRTPMVRDAGGLRAATWEEALARLGERLGPIVRDHGPDAVAFHLGNPLAHDYGSWIFGWLALRLFGARQVYTTATVDHMPMMTAAAHMFGGRDTASFTVPTPDVDRCRLLVLIGSNPLVSNATGMTAPRGRLEAIRARGGRIVVVDPARTRTAAAADEHLAIRPGGDAALLAALLHVVFDEGLQADLDGGLYTGAAELRAAVRPFTPERVAARTGLAPDDVRHLAREIAATPGVAIHGRVGAMLQPHGSVTCWLMWALTAVTGNLDVPGGMLFPQGAAASHATRGSGPVAPAPPSGRWHTPDGRHAEVLGELPVAALPDGILGGGAGRIRALVTMASNGARSTPDSARYEQALDAVDLLVCVDPYVNETTRHADIILPPPSPLQRDHHDLFFEQLFSHNHTRWTPPVLPLGPGELSEHEILLELVRVLAGLGDLPRGEIDDLLLTALIQELVDEPGSVLAGRDPHALFALVAGHAGRERGLDVLLRAGPYGDRFGERPGGLTLSALKDLPEGLDLGPLQPRLPGVLRTPTGRVQLAPEVLVDDLARVADGLGTAPGLVIVGRRQVHSNNSWLHNAPSLMKAKGRCTLQVNPDDARTHGVADGGLCRVQSAAGSVVATVEVTDAMRPGVVSLPHGWGHDGPGLRLAVASAQPGANLNALTGPAGLDVPSGNAALNGVQVSIEPVVPAAGAAAGAAVPTSAAASAPGPA